MQTDRKQNPAGGQYEGRPVERRTCGRPISFWVLVLVGACQSGTVWAGSCLIHHHHGEKNVLALAFYMPLFWRVHDAWRIRCPNVGPKKKSGAGARASIFPTPQKQTAGAMEIRQATQQTRALRIEALMRRSGPFGELRPPARTRTRTQAP